MLKDYFELTDEEVVKMKRGIRKTTKVIGISGAAITLYLIGVRKGKENGFDAGIGQGLIDTITMARSGALDINGELTYNGGTRTFIDSNGNAWKKY